MLADGDARRHERGSVCVGVDVPEMEELAGAERAEGAEEWRGRKAAEPQHRGESGRRDASGGSWISPQVGVHECQKSCLEFHVREAATGAGASPK